MNNSPDAGLCPFEKFAGYSSRLFLISDGFELGAGMLIGSSQSFLLRESICKLIVIQCYLCFRHNTHCTLRVHDTIFLIES